MSSKSARVEVFARVKPCKQPSGYLAIEENKLTFDIPKDDRGGYVNHQKEHFDFTFDHIFPPETMQDEIFDNVAKGVINNVLDGYNGTVFAYGQTGSGKTYTMTGGTELYSQRGIIPRTLAYLFSEFKKVRVLVSVFSPLLESSHSFSLVVALRAACGCAVHHTRFVS